MIRKYRFGKPFETEAVTCDLPLSEGTPAIGSTVVSEDGFMYTYTMAGGDIVYGLGEQVRGINKRGHRYVSWATDEMLHLESKNSLYGSHNFLILQPELRETEVNEDAAMGAGPGGEDAANEAEQRPCFGLFIDHPGRVTFDVGHTKLDTLTISCSGDLYLYVITGIDPWDVTKQFRKCIGRSYIAPKWAFGIQQSRWGYVDEADIREVIKGYRDKNLPLDAIYLDIDYMKDYKDFTVDPDRYPDFEGLVSQCKAQGIHLVPIIDAGVKIQKGYDVYEEGLKGGYFCKDQDGAEVVAAVWPGRVHMPDFLNPEARKWFGRKYACLTDKGIDGFWNDMNEPALFYIESSLNKVMDELIEMRKTNMGIEEVFKMKGMVMSMGGTDEEYRAFYHDTPQGRIRHDKVHNIYGYNMTRAASEAFEEICPDRRILMFSRSSCIGSHRYGGIWTGDNQSWWSHLLLSIQQMPSLNMCGFMYTGSDVGGFSADTTEDLMIRWMSFAIFTPLFRNHSVRFARRQEPYLFEDTETMRAILQLRYALLPYLYSEYMKACLTDDLLFVPLGFAFPEDEEARGCEDQLMVGESIMIAPVYVQNARGRMVYLPEDMLRVNLYGSEIQMAGMMKQGYHRVSCELGECLVFVRKGHVLPLAKDVCEMRSARDLKEDSYLWVGCPDTGAEYAFYKDEGCEKVYKTEAEWTRYHFTARDFGGDCICEK